ncbi:hypothetical protein AB7W42_21910 [Providencia rettgeri]
MKSVFFLFASVVLAPVGYALTDDQQFLEQLRDQSAALLEPSLPPEGFSLLCFNKNGHFDKGIYSL